MDRFKIGDVAYHRAGSKLLGTVCEIKGDKVIIRRVETLLEVGMHPEELKTQTEIEQENSVMLAQVNQSNRDRWGLDE
jgi:hypothetical protein